MNTTMYCTAVRRRAETFSSRPNINPQFLPAGIGAPARNRRSLWALESYWKHYLYSNLQPALPEILQRKRKFSTRMLVVIKWSDGRLARPARARTPPALHQQAFGASR